MVWRQSFQHLLCAPSAIWIQLHLQSRPRRERASSEDSNEREEKDAAGHHRECGKQDQHHQPDESYCHVASPGSCCSGETSDSDQLLPFAMQRAPGPPVSAYTLPGSGLSCTRSEGDQPSGGAFFALRSLISVRSLVFMLLSCSYCSFRLPVLHKT